MRRNLKPLVINWGPGLVTKLSRMKTNGVGLLQAENAEGYERLGTVGKVAGSSRVSDVAPDGWTSLHYFEYFKLDGTLTREVVGLADGNFYQIQSDRSLRYVGGGYAEESLADCQMFDRIHLTCHGNAPFKYDGTSLTNWGVRAPGDTPTVLDPIEDDIAIWGPGNAFTTIVADTSLQRELDGSIEVRKGVGAGVGDVFSVLVGDFTAAPLNMTDTTVYFWFLMPAGVSPRMAQTSTLTVRIGDGIWTNYSEWSFDLGQLPDGWNLLSFPSATPETTGGTGANLASVVVVQFTLTHGAYTFTETGFRFAKLYKNDDGEPVAVAGAAGSITGSVSYRVTYLTRYGVESNAGPSSNTVLLGAASQVGVTFPASSDPQVIARRIYRDAGDSVFRFVTQINDNSTTSYTDNTSASARGFTTPPLAADESIDHSQPPRMISTKIWKQHVFGINAENQFELVLSNPGDPETFPLLFRRQFEEKLIGFAETFRYGLLLLTTDSYYRIDGESIADFTFTRATTQIGMTSPRAVAEISGVAFVWHDTGGYILNGANEWYSSAQIRDEIDALPSEEFANLFTVSDTGRSRVLIFVRTAPAGLFSRIYVYSYGEQAGRLDQSGVWVDSLDLREAKWYRMALPSGVEPNCAAAIETTADRTEVWIGCDNGIVYRLQDPDEVNWATGAGSASTAVSTTIETTPILVDEGRWGTVRLMQFTGFCTNPSTWTVTLQLFNGASGPIRESGSVTFQTTAGDFDITISAPPLGRAPWASIILSNSTSGEDGVFEPPILYTMPGRQRGIH